MGAFLHRSLGSRFLNIFDKYYAYCSLTQNCPLVPASTPDSAFYSGSVYYPLGKPEDPTFYWLYRMRQEQSAAQRADFLINLHDANGKMASSTYRIYHNAVLNSEKQAGKMFTSLIGIEERVSPNEIDEDSIYSIYHRTVEWTRKKEIGVVVFNSYPVSVKEIIKLYVATPDLCIYNSVKMIQRQQLTQIKDKLWELVLPTKLQANSYTTFIIHYCEGQEKENSETRSIQGKWLDGDVYRLEFDETGRFTAITNKQDSVLYRFEADLAVLTPSPSNPHLHIPHGLPPSDPSYLSPVALSFFSQL